MVIMMMNDLFNGYFEVDSSQVWLFNGWSTTTQKLDKIYREKKRECSRQGLSH